MSDYFIENRKFLGLNGVIGRRDFIINYFIIELISTLLWTFPFLIMIFLKPGFLSKVMDSVFLSSAHQPFILVLGFAILGLLVVPLYFSSIVRRVRDILGEEDENRVYLISSVLSVICYMAYTPVGFVLLGKWIVLFVFLVLMFWEGKITSKKPASDIIKFNYGAFWGTWMWGLKNKVYVTLWAIPLLFTFGILPFMIICGLKGNEWAYNKKKDADLDTFHKEQSKDATIFSIAAPFIVLGCMIFTSVCVTYGFVKTVKGNPVFAKKFDVFVRSNEEAIVNSTFKTIELTDDEYKFFLNPMLWDEETRFARVSAFKTAVNYVILQEDKDKQKNNTDAEDSKKDSLNSYAAEKIRRYIEVANKTKIYSTFNNEVLAQFHLDSSEYEDALKNLDAPKDLKNIYKIMDKGYKFNIHPSIP